MPINDKTLAGRLQDIVPMAMRMIRQEMRGRAGKQLSVPQFRILVQLYRQPMLNHDLADHQGVAVATMSRMVDLLVRRGLVIRHGVPSDRRKVFLSLSRPGKSRFERIRKAVRRSLALRLARLNRAGKIRLNAGITELEKCL
jgi:DNA-binding MarR family transcriptional regulator